MRFNNTIWLAFLFVLVICSGRVFAQEVTIDLSKEYQTIKGFGGMNFTTWVKDLNDDSRAKAFGNAPGEMGLSILRIHLDPDSSRFNLELPTALYAIQKGASVFATPWNAPDAVLDKTATQSRVDPAKYGQYVDHLNSFSTYMYDNGAPLYAISVQNEPDYGEWTRWTSDEMLNFMRNYAQDINGRVIAPESFQFRRVFTDPILKDSIANSHFDIVGGHIYGGGLFDYPLAREKGKEVWMTEHLLGSNENETNDWNLALTVGKEINDCMKANFNAYVWWYIRRFYGLITDDGNITDKGYVISQYAKFVRPGAVRVDASVASASLVDVTAYKTDTSFVMVVVNRNNKSVELNFNIANGNFEKLTQFTSSETKKVANDGEVAAPSGQFKAIVEPKSITTFTTYAGNGGKLGNAKPVAFAGDDLLIDDVEGLGSAEIIFDGSQSTDADGIISNYSWSLNGQQVAWEAKSNLKIAIGKYDLVLTVTDNDGATATDTLHVEFSSSKSTEIWLESECGTVGSSWQKLSDVDASNDSYIVTTDGVQSTASASTNPNDLLVYNFTTTESGSFKVWGRVITPSANDDSYWVKVDESDWVMWNSIPSGTTWHWDDVHNQSNDNPVFYELQPGDHTLTVCMREDGAKLDKILIANTGITPANMGGDATGCSIVVPEPESVDVIKGSKGVFEVYPNPTTGKVNISWDKKFNSLQVFNYQGQSVFSKEYPSEIEKTDAEFDFGSGIYFIVLRNNNLSTTKKLIVE